jgi:hypothetical protein
MKVWAITIRELERGRADGTSTRKVEFQKEMAVRLMARNAFLARSAVTVAQDDFVTYFNILDICSFGDDDTGAYKQLQYL